MEPRAVPPRFPVRGRHKCIHKTHIIMWVANEERGDASDSKMIASTFEAPFRESRHEPASFRSGVPDMVLDAKAIAARAILRHGRVSECMRSCEPALISPPRACLIASDIRTMTQNPLTGEASNPVLRRLHRHALRHLPTWRVTPGITLQGKKRVKFES